VNARALLIFLFFTASAKGALAQLLIGPEVGANYSWVSFDDIDLKNTYKVKPVVGYSAGMHVGFRVRKRFFLHLSLLYSTKGKTLELKDENKANPYDVHNLHDKVRYNYIDLPIIYTVDFKGKIGGNKEFKYNLGIGPVVSYWLGGKGTIENNDTYEFSTGIVPYKVVFYKDPKNGTDNEMIVQHPNRLQLGLNVTGSIIFEPLPGRQIMLTARYELGGTFLSSQSNGQIHPTIFQEPLASHNRGFRISLAYLLDLKTDQRKKGKSTSTIRKGKRK